MDIKTIVNGIFELAAGDEKGFEPLWQEVYDYQRTNCRVYNRYCISIGDIYRPYLPIEAFKRAPVTTFDPGDATLVFESSGTGQGGRSRHYVRDALLYERSFTEHFRQCLGAGPFTMMAHLPHYAQMGETSSLLYMVERLIDRFGNDSSGFFLEDWSKLLHAIDAGQPAPFVLFGAAFGLLDLIDQQPVALPGGAIVIETGGMKTYRREITRDELHGRLAAGFGIPESQVWSEYGMCELLSQCYTRGGRVFHPPPWMRFEIMNPENPLEPQVAGRPGALAVIDLANLHSVSAILTQDRAVRRGEGFEVLGRLNGAELRGCNFLLDNT